MDVDVLRAEATAEANRRLGAVAVDPVYIFIWRVMWEPVMTAYRARETEYEAIVARLDAQAVCEMADQDAAVWDEVHAEDEAEWDAMCGADEAEAAYVEAAELQTA